MSNYKHIYNVTNLQVITSNFLGFLYEEYFNEVTAIAMSTPALY